MYNDMIENSNIPKSNIVVINNPITDKFKLKQKNKSDEKRLLTLITVGSFKKQKGHLRLLEVLARLNFDFKYYMVGDGHQKEEIFKAIDKYNLHKKIVHIPFTKNVAKYLSISDYFIQGSYVEGFPNCLIESCAVGTPIIAFDAPGGLNEIITSGVNGYIVKDSIEFINYLKAPYHWKPEEVRQVVMDKFSKDIILSKYENLFLNLLK